MMTEAIDNDIRAAIEAAVRKKIGPAARDISISMKRGASGEYECVVTVEVDFTNRDPVAIGEKFFGLTGKVQKAMGDRFRDVFPVIQPVTMAHA
ncbi:hypothetical protein [Falsirhodobacter halotolerans]|uniref:hypothetical protein n=1 Tax=Falsirhodobacter halotolerans TaxID=1146892 RepID=UPI001FD1093D|nr:hypothetical protein [Falsirhodobacter halotolerans]MCJ8138453.1 hypothetical protein [Falsirhodobacter halotolerans]